jgi:uncharacterized membrane protein YozB (DUF420 family)
MIPYLPAVDASLNAASAIFLVLGFFFVREKAIRAHKRCMLSAFVTSTIFLVCYLTYHYFHGTTHFLGQGGVRDFYFVLLGSHTVLAALLVPLAVTTLYRAWRERFQQHKRIGRWTLPLWLYVSVTGVLVYWMLYHLYPSR